MVARVCVGTYFTLVTIGVLPDERTANMPENVERTGMAPEGYVPDAPVLPKCIIGDSARFRLTGLRGNRQHLKPFPFSVGEVDHVSVY